LRPVRRAEAREIDGSLAAAERSGGGGRVYTERTIQRLRNRIMAAAKGFLLVTMEPPPTLEEEFNDWYDTEHVPGRLGIAGFETGLRFVCLSGWPKYLSFYDLTTIAVLESEAYKAAAWGGFSPWTKRMLAKVRGQYRASGDQI